MIRRVDLGLEYTIGATIKTIGSMVPPCLVWWQVVANT